MKKLNKKDLKKVVIATGCAASVFGGLYLLNRSELGCRMKYKMMNILAESIIKCGQRSAIIHCTVSTQVYGEECAKEIVDNAIRSFAEGVGKHTMDRSLN